MHRGEYVMSAAATRRLGVGNLESLHRSAKRGYAEGGLVSGLAFPNTDKPLAGNLTYANRLMVQFVTKLHADNKISGRVKKLAA